MKNIIIKEFLEKIAGDISYIDGGCPRCIRSFCEGVNETLVEYNLKLVYDENYDNPLAVIKINE